MQSTIYHNVLHNEYPILTMVELVHVGDQQFWEINFLCPRWKGSTFDLIHVFFLLRFKRGGGEGIFLVFIVFSSKFPVRSHHVPTIISFFFQIVWPWFNFHLHELWGKGIGKQRDAWQNNVFLNFGDATIFWFLCWEMPQKITHGLIKWFLMRKKKSRCIFILINRACSTISWVACKFCS
jgi:hypothetical protein